MITIGIPFYNDEKFLELAIKSVIKQTYTDWKLILIDDGSSDRSLEIAKKYETLDNRIKVNSDGLNKKLATRLNEIANLAQTKYLARMDADDIMHPERIEKQLKILENHPEIDVLGTNAYSIDENDNIQGIRMMVHDNQYELLNCKSFIHPSIMAKTTWFKANPYDEKMVKAQDYELWQRTASDSNFKVYTEPLLFYREFGSNYYKKYFSGFSSKFYVARKSKKIYSFYIAFEHLFKGVIYRVYSLLGKEQILINKRFHKISKHTNSKVAVILNNIKST